MAAAGTAGESPASARVGASSAGACSPLFSKWPIWKSSLFLVGDSCDGEKGGHSVK